MDHEHMGDDLAKVLLTEEQIQARLAELAADIWRDYEGKEFLLVGVLKGAVVVMADLMRALPGTAPMDWMAVSSYGSGTKSSGVVRILKDLDTDITGRHVLIVEDIIDSGLTLSWIKSNLESRKPRLGGDLHAAAQARRRQGRHPGQVRRLRHPQRVRRRLRPRLRREVPQPALRRHPRAARLRVTFSIVARQGDAHGIAVASKFLAVGAVVPGARLGVGAVATQSFARVAYLDELLGRLAAGESADDALDAATALDEGRETRQVGVVGLASAATFTGSECNDWAGGVARDDGDTAYAIQGNILTGPEVVEAMERAWHDSTGQPLARRLLAALVAGDEAGGDSRGRQSAAMYAVEPGSGYDACGVLADLRVDDHADPVTELGRLLSDWEMYFGKPEDVSAARGRARRRGARPAGACRLHRRRRRDGPGRLGRQRQLRGPSQPRRHRPTRPRGPSRRHRRLTLRPEPSTGGLVTGPPHAEHWWSTGRCAGGQTHRTSRRTGARQVPHVHGR